MKKRIISALLAVCLLVSLGTVGVFADEGAPTDDETATTQKVVKVGDVEYTSLDEAMEHVTAGSTITLLDDVTVTVPTDKNAGKIVINQNNVTFDGDGHTITAALESGSNEGGHVLLVQATGVKIKDLTIDGNSVARHGIQAHGNAGLTIENVDSNNNVGYGLLVNNGATVTASDFDASGNGWGGVNVEAQDKTSSFTMYSGNLKGNGADGNISVVLDSDAKGTNTVNLTGGTYATVMTNTEHQTEGERSQGTNNITISNATVDTLSLNGVGTDTATVGGNSVVSTLTSTNEKKPSVTVRDNAKVTAVTEGNTANIVVGGNGSVGGNVGTKAEAEIKGQPYATLAEALADAKAGDVVKLLRDITVDLKDLNQDQGYFVINTSITLDGGNNKITATSTNTAEGKGQAHVIVVSNGNVTIQNLEIDGGNQVARYGIQAVGTTANVTLKNVEVNNCYAYGAFSNQGATVTANGLYTDDNGWGGVNVDTNGGNSKFVMNSGILADKYSIVIENSKSTNNTTSIDLNGGTYSPIQVKTDDTKLVINRGTYDGIEVVPTVNITNEITVNNGTFGESVKGYVNGNLIYEVRVGSEYTYYTNATDAIRAAGSVGDITYIGNDTYYTSNVTFVYDKNVKTTIEVVDNEVIYLPGGQYKGKTITGWTLGNVTYKDGDRYKVNGNATFYVVLKDGEFDIVIDSKIEHGDISTNVNSADKGDTVYIYVDPDTGYVLDDIDVYYGYNYRNSVKVSYVRNNTYRFEMPNADVYITATFKANGMPFVDVHRTQWFYDSIYYVWSNDMMEGDSATTFNPDGTMTRAMFWAVLGRMDGQTITGTNWVEQARNWAMREGVSDGTNPNDFVTREQMVTMLWRYAGEKNGSANLNRYTDSGSVSGYAVEAMRWAIGNGVIQGVTSTTLAPKANATRAECATIFMRFDKM